MLAIYMCTWQVSSVAAFAGGRGGGRFGVRGGGVDRGGRGGGGRFGGRDGGRGRGRDGGRGRGRGGGRGGMKGSAKTIVEEHRHAGVFIARGKEDALVSKNMVPGKSHHVQSGCKTLQAWLPPKAQVLPQ